VSGDYAGQQYVGIDLHRRRSVIVRMTEADPTGSTTAACTAPAATSHPSSSRNSLPFDRRPRPRGPGTTEPPLNPGGSDPDATCTRADVPLSGRVEVSLRGPVA
jgi:hypothetical protein